MVCTALYTNTRGHVQKPRPGESSQPLGGECVDYIQFTDEVFLRCFGLVRRKKGSVQWTVGGDMFFVSKVLLIVTDPLTESQECSAENTEPWSHQSGSGMSPVSSQRVSCFITWSQHPFHTIKTKPNA